jgi:hypothetical protein
MLQQQQHQMTMKRAASGIMEGVLTGGGGKRHSRGTSGSPHHSGAGGETHLIRVLLCVHNVPPCNAHGPHRGPPRAVEDCSSPVGNQ